jgi:hypothetical protein
MTISKFKKAAGISTRKSDYDGWSWTCIFNHFKQNAEIGFDHGDLTAKQRDSLIEQGRNMANRFSY